MGDKLSMANVPHKMLYSVNRVWITLMVSKKINLSFFFNFGKLISERLQLYFPVRNKSVKIDKSFPLICIGSVVKYAYNHYALLGH